MGLFCVNLHVRTENRQAVAQALAAKGYDRCFVLPAQNGWVSVYEEEASSQDERRIQALAEALTRELKAPGIAFLVHDSDIACYWLVNNGQLVDEYNSCPDYFESGGGSGPSGGQADLLLPYCRAGVTRGKLEAILGDDPAFAEGIIERLADALGIKIERALCDYRDVEEGEGPDDGDGFDDDGTNGGVGDGPGPRNVLPMQSGLLGKLAGIFGLGQYSRISVDPKVLALVKAAAAGDVTTIDRLIAEGTSFEAEAPMPLSGGDGLPGVGGMPEVPMSPLLAAVMNKRVDAARRLLQAGADQNKPHAFLGSPVHVATGGGDPEMLQLLLDHGADSTTRNPQGKTPLDVLAASRGIQKQLEQLEAMMRSMGVKPPPMAEQIRNAKLPIEGWDACEKVLRAHRAQR